MKISIISKFLSITFAGLFVIFFITTSSDEDVAGPDLKFSHKFHVEESGAECAMCHPNAEDSESGTDDLLPPEEICLECHEKSEETCGDCHGNPQNPVMLARIDDYSPSFSHKKHIDEGYECEDCHSGVGQSESIHDNYLPGMQQCMGCHEVPGDIDGCYLCHGKDETLRPADHTELWMTNHGSFKESGSGDMDCASCHREEYCIECHLGENLFANSHPPEFILTHQISYMMRESDCASCHNDLDFCRECHVGMNYIIPMNHNPRDTWRARHQTEAKPIADQCMVCHTPDDPTCGMCHMQ